MIEIKWKEIKYDVDQQTWRLAKVRLQDTELQDEGQSDDSPSSSNAVLRFAEEGNAILHNLLADRLEVIPTSNEDDALRDVVVWSYDLAEGMFKTDKRSLAILMHKFVVSYILYKWCLLFYPDNAQIYKAESEETRKSIEDEAYKTGMPTKRANKCSL